MRHNCKAKDGDGLSYFKEAIVDGFIEYDDWYDTYLWSVYLEKPFLKIFKKRWGRIDVLMYCPYCGEKIFEEKKVSHG